MNYIKYDDFGISEIKCMGCLETVVAERALAEVQGKEVPMLKKNSSWHQKKIFLKNKGKSTFVEPILCSECIKKEINKKELIKQIRSGIEEALKFKRKTNTEIDTVLSDYYDLTEE